MVSFGSFDPIPISNKEHTFFSPYDVGKSLSEVVEFGPQLSKGAIPVELNVDEEVTITYIYPEMVKPDSGNRPTFYEIMTNDLDVWNSDSEFEDEIGDGWSTFISKKEKYQRSNETDGGSESKNVPGESSKTRKVISQLSNIPCGTRLTDALNLSFDDRIALIAALIDPEAYQGKVLEPIKSTTYQDCMATITFNDDDLQLGSSHLHNRPLYVSGYIRECKLHRIMIDCGSAVNIMPIKTMKKIGINVGDLSKSNIMIQGFNQKGPTSHWHDSPEAANRRVKLFSFVSCH
ncbi:Uncharacterized protein Adt_40253 [Abeliophyllum distichum]|uniref:Gag-pol polyprotein n=1 Tax=Abeliophyllum distichum TaxID=126358 RepID=A0ABD1Q8J3_9LAMI